MEEEKMNTSEVTEETNNNDEVAQEEVTNNEPSPEVSNGESSVDQLLEHYEPVVAESADDEPFDKVIEDARLVMNKNYKKSRKMSNISMLVCVILVVGCFILIVQNYAWMQIVGYVIGGCTVLFMIIWYFVNRNKLPRQIKEYVSIVSHALNAHAFTNANFTDLKTDPNDKLDLADLLADGVYKDVTAIASRNVVIGEYAHHSFKIGDVSLRSGVGKKTENIFFGKYITYPNDLHFEGRYVIVSKGKEDMDLPNDISDLTALDESDKFIIYGPEGHNYKEDLGTKIVPLLKKIDVNDPLLTLTVCFWAGHSAAYLSYTDAIISLPFEKEYDKTPFDSYVSQQTLLLDAFLTLTK